MGSLLAWQSLLFYIPLGTGLLLMAGSAMGAGSSDGDAHDADHGHDGESNQTVASSLPLLMRLGTAALLFGGTGAALSHLSLPGGLLLPLGAALIAGLLVAPLLARLLGRWAPAVETYRVSRSDLVGKTGTLVLPAGPDAGLLQVSDQEGNLHQVLCRTAGEKLPSGTCVLLIEEDPTSSVFTVEPFPPEARLTSPFLEKT